MEHGVDAVGQDVAEPLPVADVADDEARARPERRAACPLDRLSYTTTSWPAVDEALDARRAHVPRAADDENLQPTLLLVPTAPRPSAAGSRQPAGQGRGQQGRDAGRPGGRRLRRAARRCGTGPRP